MAESNGGMGRVVCGPSRLHISRQFSQEGVSQELEFLQNVYFEDLKMTRHDSGRVDLLFHVTPYTGEEINRKYIYLDLKLTLTPKYPEQAAEISVTQSRGISDPHLKDILAALCLKAASLTGAPMVYELVEHAKDRLTDNNLPCGECVICLLPFHEGDELTRTDCYHYLHVICFARYLNFYERQQQELTHTLAPPTTDRMEPSSLECPVCREPIVAGSLCVETVSNALSTLSLEEEEEQEVHISPNIRHWQQQMTRLLRQQQEKGGLIDTSARDAVIDETWVRPLPTTPSPSTAIPGQAEVREDKGQTGCDRKRTSNYQQAGEKETVGGGHVTRGHSRKGGHVTVCSRTRRSRDHSTVEGSNRGSYVSDKGRGSHRARARERARDHVTTARGDHVTLRGGARGGRGAGARVRRQGENNQMCVTDKWTNQKQDSKPLENNNKS